MTSFLRFYGSAPSSFSSKFSSACERFARRKERGVEVELSMLFADVRDSTPLAERTPAQEYKTLIQRFNSAAVTGEILVSEQAAEFAGMQVEGLERRVLELKGISEKVAVRVVKP